MKFAAFKNWFLKNHITNPTNSLICRILLIIKYYFLFINPTELSPSLVFQLLYYHTLVPIPCLLCGEWQGRRNRWPPLPPPPPNRWWASIWVLAVVSEGPSGARSSLLSSSAFTKDRVAWENFIGMWNEKFCLQLEKR